MPQGKGTYGSQVGRPKKKYDKGGSVDPFSTRNPEGVPAEQIAEAMENQNMANEGLPTTNAMDRSQVSPDTEQYGLGGKIKGKAAEVKEDIRTRTQDVRHRVGEKVKAKKRKKKMAKAHKELTKEYSKRKKKTDRQTKKALKAKAPSSSTNILDITHDIKGSEIKMEKISKKRKKK